MKKPKNKKIVVGITILFLFLTLLASSIGYYFYSLNGFKDSESVTFTVRSGASKKQIVADLKSAGLIKSQISTLAYLLLHQDLTLQAGTYTLTRNMSVPHIMDKINRGDIQLNSIKLTFVEGKNIRDYIKVIATSLKISESEVKAVFEDRKFMESLVKKYDFLTTDVLNDNIYYALEGYLFPDTYEFLESVTVEEIITRMLDNTNRKIKSMEIGSEYSLHEILTMASIVELEAVNESDRKTVAQVIYKRLEMGKGLGMDVTTYYAVQKTLGEDLTMNDLRTNSPYNTSESNTSMAGKLPIGPICNPSLMSINAVLNPSDTEYVYFYANMNTHEVFFANTYEEFLNIQKEVG